MDLILGLEFSRTKSKICRWRRNSLELKDLWLRKFTSWRNMTKKLILLALASFFTLCFQEIIPLLQAFLKRFKPWQKPVLSNWTTITGQTSLKRSNHLFWRFFAQRKSEFRLNKCPSILGFRISIDWKHALWKTKKNQKK